MLFLLFSYRYSGIHKSGSPHTPQGFAKKSLHPSGYTITYCAIIYYGMKDVSGIFQLSGQRIFLVGKLSFKRIA